jgi:2'-5' RNA ligase
VSKRPSARSEPKASVARLAVVAYPRLPASDRAWLEAWRARHDPSAARIALHFTLVFPLDAERTDVAAEVAEAARAAAPFAFAIRRARAVPDLVDGGAHVFLVPDEGAAELTALHDRLYAGRLRASLRADVPFVPHLTVAAAADVASAERLAGALDLRSRIVRGNVCDVALLDVGAPKSVKTVETYVLGRAA